MSQVTEQSVRFQTALASIKLIQASAVLDLTEDDFDFLTSNKVWIATDRSRARRCVEACVYGTLDFVGYPRDRKSGSAGMPRPISYAVFCLKKKNPAAMRMVLTLHRVTSALVYDLESSVHRPHGFSWP